MPHRRWLAGPALAGVMLLAAGCARTGPPTAPEIADQVQTALAGVTSLHVSGLIISGSSSTRVDLSVTRAGGMYGTLSSGSRQLTVLTAGGTTYLLATIGSLKAMGLPASACPVLCNRYFQLSTRAQVNKFTQGLGWSSFLGPWVGPELHQLTLSGTAGIAGRRAWVLRAPAGGTAYVAARGTPYLLRVLPGRGESDGRLDYSRWNRAVIPPVPPLAAVIPPGAAVATAVPGPAAN